ncbi:reprolysin-like metallopeptidase [Flavobacterium wongokense]|uniref:reprolysin-like metallopeptidase n=1 Tax=Flavobacterium wongokense TaxID=2910674 RepID=UPI001F2115EC|nr:zinc-dependent metalloprotease family protein [Flavobacterium sp. WG47]MCF6131274.1 M12 family metallo-peptidase [Flavobacterium sp. WG47]
MKCKLLLGALLAATCFSYAQNKATLWNTTTKKSNMVPLEAKMRLPENHLFDLNLVNLRSSLSAAPVRGVNSKQSSTILSIPNADGVLERYSIYENSSMDPALAARYPEIKSYIGIGIDNPAATAHFSVSPLGFKSMVLAPDKSAVFIEPISADLRTYTVYRKADRAQSLTPFECSVIDEVAPQVNGADARPNADDATLRTFRLAMSCTGEYTTYFGGTKALALAAINNSITRCNGVFEKDFGARLIIIANTDAVIYTSASSDPYSNASSMSQWNSQLQSTLTSVIGEANYDIGHLFGATGGGGNAGCIGCICTNGSKGSGITSPADGIPSGDNFDIDYVAHEIGHQMGANHTFTHSNEGTGVQMEPGSGSTIMGYAGITSLDIQPHSDAYFHAVSIQQVTNNIKAKTCSVNIATGNSVPTASAGLDYTIPKSTPFMLTATATDANGDALTYNWEEMDNQSNSAAPSATKTSGVDFRSYNSTTSPTRYFPRMASLLTGSLTTAGSEITVEALPSVARTMNFRVTVRDNRAGGPANNSDDMVVTVNAVAGPFNVTAPNTAVSYVGGSTQTVTWNVAGTTANGVNCANVDILISTNAGTTWSTLLAATPNDGSQAVTIPNTAGTTNRIMVKGTNHIFFDISNANFTITAGSTDTVAPTAPTLSASGTTQTSTNLSWSGATDNVGVTGYDVYKDGVLLGSTASTTYAVSGLTNSTTYVFTVKAKDAAGNVSVASNALSVTTLAPAPDTTAPTAPTLSASGTTFTSTNLSWSGATDNVAVTGYDVYKDGALIGSTTSATTFAVSGLVASTTYAFNVTAKDAAGNISANSNTVNVTTPTPDTTAPTAPTLSASGTTSSSTNLSWSGATDNVAVTGYDVYRNGSLLGSTTSATTYAVTGLTASTTYTFNVKAKDAAGNISANSNTVSVTTLANTITYCTSTSTNTADERIGRVAFGTINNPSTGTAGYENFTALSTNVVRGSANTITITPFWTSTVWTEGYAVFIDYNQDGDFSDAGETAFTKATSKTTPVTGTITIPATATLGSTRMRVSMSYNATPTACQTFTYGQVEDYTINITSSARIDEAAPARISFNVYPNPVKGDILNISNLESPSTYKIFNMMGQELGSGKIENDAIYVGSLKTGTFLIEVSNGTSTTTKRFIKE